MKKSSAAALWFALVSVFSILSSMLLVSMADAAVGRTPGTFAVSPVGTATYTIPIWAPPGPNGLQPNIGLAYNSGQGNGYVGVGWTVSGLSSIFRCNQTYAQDGAPAPVTLTSTDVFCLDGKRLRLTEGSYGVAGSTYQTEVADFSNVTAYGSAGTGPAYFVVQGRDGRTYTYGNGGYSQVLPSGCTSNCTAIGWQLNEVSDPAGNTMTIAYSTSNTSGTVVPSTISWTPTSHGASTYAYVMTFNYGANVVQSSVYGYVAGTPVVNTNLLGSVTVAYNGAIVKNYVLTYQIAPNTGRDELYTVQECASSGTSNCLAPTTVTYQPGAQGVGSVTTLSSSALQGDFSAYDLNGDGIRDFVWYNGTTWQVSWGSSSGYSTPINTGITTTSIALEDIDGSGTDSFLVPVNGSWTVYKWNGSAFTQTTVTAIVDETTQHSFALADVNGDGLPDLITTGTNGYLYVRLNTSTGGSISFSSTATQTTLSNSGLYLYSSFNDTRRLDFYGSGQQDLLAVAYLQRGTFSILHFNGTTFVPITISGNTADMADYNDDGCTDVLSSSTLYISPCQGSVGTTIALPGSAVAGIDWDSDGRRDILVTNGSTLEVYKSTGAGFTSTPITTSIPSQVGGYTTLHNPTGDGQDGLLTWTTSGIQYYLHNGAGQPPDLMSSVTDGYGNSASPTYVPIDQSNYSPVLNPTYPDVPTATYRYFTGPLYVVNQATFSDPSSSTNATYQQTFYYYDAWMSLQGRGFMGFSQQQRHDSRNGVWDTYGYCVQFPCPALPFFDLTSADQAGTQQIRYAFNNLEVATLDGTANNQRYFPYFNNMTVQANEVGGVKNGQLISTRNSSYTFDSYGNALTIATTVTDKDSSSPYFNDAWTTTTTNTPDVDTAHWCLGLFTETQVSYTASIGNSVTRTKQLTPDTTHCRYAQIVTEPSSSKYMVTEQLGYDPTAGTLLTDTVTGVGMPARTTTYVWDPEGLSPVSVTDPSGAQTQPALNYSFGVPSSFTDANGVKTSWTYDGFGRRTQEVRGDQTSTTWSYATCTSCDARARMVININQLDTGGHTLSSQTVWGDHLDREIYGESQEVTGTEIYTVSRSFDSLGRTVTEYLPYVASGSSPGAVQYAYDVEDRLIKRTRPTSASNSSPVYTYYTYKGRTTVIEDELQNLKTVTADVNGWQRQTEDASGYTVITAYDAAGSKTGVTDSANNTLWGSATYAYGVAPFLLGATDMDLGPWTFTYDALGEKTGWTDNNGHNSSVTYDALSRPLTRTEPDLFTQWTWGSSVSSHNVGRVQSVCTGITGTSACSAGGYAETESYDTLGRQAQRSITVPTASTPYVYAWTYSSTTGLLAALTYPTSSPGFALQLKYAYAYNIPQSISAVLPSSTVTVWTANASDPQGHVTQETLGNGIQTNRAFDAVTGALGSIQSGIGGGAGVSNLGFLYDAVGDVIERQDNNRGLTENIYYDNDYRLTSSKLNGTQNLLISYDLMGNITSRSDVAGGATWTYDPVRKHAVVQAGSSSFAYSYDGNGNMTSRQGSAIHWSSANYPIAVSAGSGSSAESVSFMYGPDRQRWEQSYTGNGGSETTSYIGGLMEVVSGSSGTTYRHYIPGIGSTVAIYSMTSGGTGTLDYVLSDHDNSVSVITNSSGGALVGESFTPFGARRNPTSWSGSPVTGDLTTAAGITRQAYTFQTQLGLWMGLNHMNGRVEDAVTGRFLSADPTIPDPTNTQAYDRYSYVINNPLTYIDPSGFCWGISLDDGQEFDDGLPCPEINIPGLQNPGTDPGSTPGDTNPGDTPPGYTTPGGAPRRTAPIVPHGSAGPQKRPGNPSPQGNQPTSEVTVTASRDSCPGAGGDPLGFRQSAPNDPSQGYQPVHDLPAGSFIVTAPNGTQFYAPPGADFVAVYQYGSSLASMGTGIDFGLAWAHGFGGPFDFQRGNNQFNRNFSYAANYAIGIDFAAAGQPLSYPLSLASLVKNTLAGGRGFQYAPQAIQQGYTAAQSGACGP